MMRRNARGRQVRRGLRSLTILSILSMGLLSVWGSAKGAEPAPTTVILDATRQGPVISPLLFGFNLEHTRHALWKGLSAQLLANRSFAAREATRAPKQVQQETAAHWFGVGARDVSLALDGKEVFTGKQSQRVRVPTGGAWGGIGQRGLPLQGGSEYEIRLQLKAEPSVTVAVRLCDASGKTEYLRRSQRIEKGDWRTWRFRCQVPRTDREARLEILCEGPGTLWLGAASLLPAENFHGMRRDVIARLKELSVPILRWPGGNFTRYYRWKEGLLPLDKRPPLFAETLPFCDNFDFQELGIDEFMALCRELDSRPCLTVTMGIPEGAQEAADWVEYCNGSATTTWGKVRARHGHAEPYRVRHWCVGNEIWGNWMGPAHTSAAEYARNLKQFAAAMRKVDPSLVLIASGTDAVTLGNDWDKIVAAQAGEAFDWHSLHNYAPITTALTGPQGVREFTRQACRARDGVLPWLREMRRAVDQSSPRGKRIGFAFDEWNLWHRWFTRWYETDWHVGPIDAAFAAGMLHMFCQESEKPRPEDGGHVPAGQRRPDPGDAVLRGPDGHGPSVRAVPCPPGRPSAPDRTAP